MEGIHFTPSMSYMRWHQAALFISQGLQHLTMPDKILRAMLERFTALAGTNRVTGPFGDPATPSIAQNAPPLSIAVGFYALHKNTGNQNSILCHPLEIAHTKNTIMQPHKNTKIQK